MLSRGSGLMSSWRTVNPPSPESKTPIGFWRRLVTAGPPSNRRNESSRSRGRSRDPNGGWVPSSRGAWKEGRNGPPASHGVSLSTPCAGWTAKAPSRIPRARLPVGDGEGQVGHVVFPDHGLDHEQVQTESSSTRLQSCSIRSCNGEAAPCVASSRAHRGRPSR